MGTFQFLNKYRILILMLIFLLYFSFIIPQLDTSFVLDEAAFIDAAKTIAIKGKPFISDLKSWDNEFYDGTKSFYYHPTLYINILAIIIKIFGENTIALRAVSALFVFMSSIILYLITKKIAKDKKKELIALTGILIFLINPFVIKNGLLIEINGTVLMLTTLIFTYFFINKYESKRKKDIVCLGLLMGLVMWSKFEGVILLTISLFVFYFLKKGFKEAFVRTAIISTIGIGLFSLSWLPVATIQGIDFFAPFKHNLMNLVPEIGKCQLLQKTFYMTWTIKNFFFWMTPTFLLLGLFIIIKKIQKYIKRTFINKADFLIIFSFILLILATLRGGDAYGFPKYVVLAVPFLSIIISIFVINNNYLDKISSKKNIAIILTLVVLLMAFNFIVIKDPFIDHNLFWTKHLLLDKDMFLYFMANLKGIIFFIPIIITFLVLLLLKLNMKQTFIISCFFLIFINSFYISYIQSRAGYSTIYAYGQEGLKETADFLKKVTDDEDAIVGRYDVCYHTKLKCYESYPTTKPWDDIIKNALKDKNLKYAVFTPSDRPEEFPDLETLFSLEKEIGHFVVHKRK